MPNYTHKGWLWLCPIYLNANDPDDGQIEPRHWSFLVLFWLGFLLEFVRIFLTSCFVRGYEPSFMFLVTGGLRKR